MKPDLVRKEDQIEGWFKCWVDWRVQLQNLTQWNYTVAIRVLL